MDFPLLVLEIIFLSELWALSSWAICAVALSFSAYSTRSTDIYLKCTYSYLLQSLRLFAGLALYIYHLIWDQYTPDCSTIAMADWQEVTPKRIRSSYIEGALYLRKRRAATQGCACLRGFAQDISKKTEAWFVPPRRAARACADLHKIWFVRAYPVWMPLVHRVGARKMPLKSGHVTGARHPTRFCADNLSFSLSNFLCVI